MKKKLPLSLLLVLFKTALVSLLLATATTVFGEIKNDYFDVWKYYAFITLIVFLSVLFVKRRKEYIFCKKLSQKWNLPVDMIYFGLYDLHIDKSDRASVEKIEDWPRNIFCEEFEAHAHFYSISITKYKRLLH